MKYKIYELEENDILQKVVAKGYNIDTINKNVLIELSIQYSNDNYRNLFDSFENAQNYIIKNSKELINKKLIILQIFDIDYNGEVL
jgi:hypothetical protein